MTLRTEGVVERHELDQAGLEAAERFLRSAFGDKVVPSRSQAALWAAIRIRVPGAVSAYLSAAGTLVFLTEEEMNGLLDWTDEAETDHQETRYASVRSARYKLSAALGLSGEG